MKVKYENIEFEFDVAPFIIDAASKLNFFKKRELLGRIEGPTTLISSNLFAIKEGTQINTPSGSFQAAPLLKPKPDGTASFIRSGYPVTGVWDVLGQVELGHALGSLCKSFTVSYDYDPNLNLNQNLICFGSPSSNSISGNIYTRLESILGSCFKWGAGFNSFFLNKEEFSAGNDGVVLFYDSPWERNKKVLVLSGLGPIGTLGCSKLVSKWSNHVVSRKQKKSNKFIAVIKYENQAEPGSQLSLKRFIFLE